ncbi:malate dehydrogenase [Naegleria gruberi]|uniref:Malate dehydrogenase n=1 Tax=Naegleria gruberi TaxID=5762 RepID=D2VA17_NAEGR|nr:malate dehydrogenase [Naegleria gruberi]EFC46229.1 malate dehydrogenase [Naegleria gruberi]|eukprot:XP_002678973.1 malate dehydrogenase [Naegleria gruberi strain NEG-M]
MTKPTMKVLVTGAAGQICYSLIGMIASGQMLGFDQPIILHLLEVPVAMDALKGVCMEITDSAYPLVKKVVATSDYQEAFTDIDVCIMVGAMPRKDGMERKDLLEKNASIFKGQGEALEKYSKKSVKVLVVGNPANTNCLIAKTYAPSIPAENFSALTRLDHNRAKAQVADRLGVNVSDVHNVTIWGNHSSTQYPDVSHGYVTINGEKKSITEAVNDDAWLKGDFISTVQKRGAAVIAARKLSSATSAAKAIVDHVHDWVLGTPEGEWVSMAIPSDGSYGIPEGVIYSFPVTCKDGVVTIVQGLKIDDFSRNKMEVTDKELREEKQLALN